MVCPCPRRRRVAALPRAGFGRQGRPGAEEPRLRHLRGPHYGPNRYRRNPS